MTMSHPEEQAIAARLILAMVESCPYREALPKAKGCVACPARCHAGYGRREPGRPTSLVTATECSACVAAMVWPGPARNL